MQHKVLVYEWNESRARRRVPLDVLSEIHIDGPEIIDGHGDVDAVRRVAASEVARRFPAMQVRGLSFLVGGGLSAVVGVRHAP